MWQWIEHVDLIHLVVVALLGIALVAGGGAGFGLLFRADARLKHKDKPSPQSLPLAWEQRTVPVERPAVFDAEPDTAVLRLPPLGSEDLTIRIHFPPRVSRPVPAAYVDATELLDLSVANTVILQRPEQ